MKKNTVIAVASFSAILSGLAGLAVLSFAFIGADPLTAGIVGSLLVASSAYSFFQARVRTDSDQRLERINEKAARLVETVCKQRTEKSDPYENLEACIHILEADLLEGRRKERAIIKHSVDVICIIDVSARFLSVSPVASKAWGYTSDELIGTLLTDYVTADDASSTLDTVLGAEDSVDVLAFETRLRRKDGKLLTLLWSAHWSASDRGLFCIVHDVTARKQAEELLRQSEERLKTILSKLPLGVLLVATDEGIIEFANDAALSLIDIPKESLAQHTLHDFMPSVPARGVPAFLQNIESLPASTSELAMVRADGSKLHVDLTTVTVIQNQHLYHLCACIDITAKKEIEELKRDFVAMVSHDLRSPLTSIGMSLNLLLTGRFGDLTEQGNCMIERSIDNANQLLHLVSALIDLEQADSGTLVTELCCVPLEEIVEQSVDTVQQIAVARKILLTVDKNPLLESLVNADRSRLAQVMVNLLANAIKFSPDSSSINVSCEKDDRFIRIIIEDRGRGVPREYQRKIFERFKQTHTTDRTEKGGSGLGLAICKRIVEEHGGQIGVLSEPGNGSQFWFTVPVYKRVTTSGEA